MEYEFPAADEPIDPSWWAPLEAVARVAQADPRYRFFEIGDFMLMGKLVRRPRRPDILEYKHYFTRRYLHLDQAGHAYLYCPPKDIRRSGSHRLHRSLRAALDHLQLWELPWMKTSLDAERCGLAWRDRWLLHPDH